VIDPLCTCGVDDERPWWHREGCLIRKYGMEALAEYMKELSEEDRKALRAAPSEIFDMAAKAIKEGKSGGLLDDPGLSMPRTELVRLLLQRSDKKRARKPADATTEKVRSQLKRMGLTIEQATARGQKTAISIAVGDRVGLVPKQVRNHFDKILAEKKLAAL
jgi:hypothetical protein